MYYVTALSLFLSLAPLCGFGLQNFASLMGNIIMMPLFKNRKNITLFYLSGDPSAKIAFRRLIRATRDIGN
jgi:hypothetical protein